MASFGAMARVLGPIIFASLYEETTVKRERADRISSHGFPRRPNSTKGI
jgi:hypothetical protein